MLNICSREECPSTPEHKFRCARVEFRLEARTPLRGRWNSCVIGLSLTERAARTRSL